MQAYNASEWNAYDGEKKIQITRRHMVDLEVSSTSQIQVLGLRKEEGHSPVVLKSGKSFRFRCPLVGFDEIIIKPTLKEEYGLKIVHSPRQIGEQNSGERAPVASLPEPTNLVQQMRRLAAAHHSHNRMPVLEPEDGPSFGRYEYDDDQELMFEEEAIEAAQAKKAAAKKKAQEQRKEATSTTPPQTAGGETPSATTEPTPPSGDQSPPPTQPAS